MDRVEDVSAFRMAANGALSVSYPSAGKIREVVKGLQSVFGVSDAEAELCVQRIEAAQGVSMTVGSILATPEFKPWLEAARAEMVPYYWDRYRQMLIQGGRFPAKVVGIIDQVTDRVLGHCEDPCKDGAWDRRGMVVGHVQSGKTANYT